MKIALIHDYLCGKGGAERVFQYICEEFPSADVYTLACNPAATFPYFSSRPMRTTWLNPFVRSMNAFRWSFPLATYAMEGLDLSAYDLVLSSSATVAKYVRVPNGRHVCYCYIPTRALWHFEQYFGDGFKAKVVRPLLPYLRHRDLQAAARVDEFIAISKVSQQYIADYYDRKAEVIYCPIDLNAFKPGAKKDHFLIVSRLEYWKRVDYAVEAFNRLGLPLRIIGVGEEMARLRASARPNISFLGEVDDVRLAAEYAEASAVIFTPFLEYGLIPLEANASGTPVVCFGKGGVTETLISANGQERDAGNATAIFFYEQTPEALIQAITTFQRTVFHAEKLVHHTSKWAVPRFKEKLRQKILCAGQQEVGSAL